jgi:hypothetical protein
VFCYGDNAPFEPLTFKDYTFASQGSILYVGFEQFRAMGVLDDDPDVTEEFFYAHPNACLSDKVISALSAAHSTHRNKLVIKDVDKFLHFIKEQQYAVTSFCHMFHEADGELAVLRGHRFVDDVHKRMQFFTVWNSMDEAREKAAEAAGFDNLGFPVMEADPDRLLFYDSLQELVILREQLYYSMLLCENCNQYSKGTLVSPITWCTRKAVEYAVRNGLEHPVEPYQAWYAYSNND